MGVVKYSGPVASFHCPTEATIRSLKVHFSPKQLGEGTPSPENVREIVGWDGVTVHNDRDWIVIPAEYQKIEYLQTPGGGTYINSGIVMSEDIVFEIDFQVTEVIGGRYFMGKYDGTSFYLYLSSGNTMFQTAFGALWANTNLASDINRHKFVYSFSNGKSIVKSNDDVIWERSILSMSTTNILVAGTSTSSGSIPVKTFSSKMTKNGVVIQNLIPCRRKTDNKPGMYDTVSGEFFTNQGTGEFICGPDVDETVEYEFGVLGKNKFPLRTTNQFLNTSTGWSNTHTRNMTTGDVFVHISSNNYWNGRSDSAYGISIGDGSVSYHAASSSYGMGVFVPVSPNTEYTLSHAETAAMSRIGYYDSEGNHLDINLSFTGTSKTFITTTDTAYILIVFATDSAGTEGDYTVSNIQLELGSTATAYEPYDPNKTVYGGWVDLVTGKVVATYLKYIFNSLQNWKATTRVSTTGGYYFYGDLINQPTYYCSLEAHQLYQSKQQELFTHGEIDNPYSENKYCAWVFQPNSTQVTFRVSLPDSLNITTSSQFKDWLDEQEEVAIVYPLATPQEYSLAPIALKTFLAKNNVWSNADYVEVEYDLHETQDILARKQFIMANQPHIETLTPSLSPSFNTDIAAPLKECKVYFNPIQAGSGDPSPDNVRPITGWTVLTTYHSGENLYIPNENNKGYIKNNGTIVVDDHSTYTDLIPVVAGDIYSFKCTTVSIDGSTNRRLHGYDSSGNWVSQLKVATTAKNTVENVNIIVTIPSGISYIRVSFRLGDTNPRVAKENVYEVNWNDNRTIYGGYVDMARGEVVQIWKELNLSATKWSYIASTNRFETPYLDDADRTKDLITVISDTYLSVVNQTGASFNTSIGDMAMCFNISSGRPYIVLHDSRFTSAEELIGSFSDHQMFYKLAEPIHYPIDPITLKTLRGTNNIWSSANGPIEVKYWTH